MASGITLSLRPSRLFLRKPQNQDGKVEGSQHKSLESRALPKLCTFEELPAWYQDNPQVRTGYRPVSNSFQACMISLTYLHNESLNIYTHLIPALVVALSLPAIHTVINIYRPNASLVDRLIFTSNILSALVTFTLSSTYHTFMNHSYPVSAACLLLDFSGILSLILSSFISGIYVGFYCVPFLQKLYWTMIISLILITALLVLHPRLQGPKYRPERTLAFVLTALSGFAPVVHGVVRFGWRHAWERSGMPFWLLEGALYGLGAYLFAARVPEKWCWERFDIWGSSHQLFHICVVLGAGSHLWGVWDAWGKHLEGGECLVLR